MNTAPRQYMERLTGGRELDLIGWSARRCPNGQ